MQRFARRFTSLVAVMEDGLVVAVLTTMIAVAFGQIVLRNALGMGFSWTDGLLRHLILWIGLAGAMVAARENRHLSIDVLSYLLPRRWLAAVAVLADAATAGVCLLVARYCLAFVIEERMYETTVFADLPAWPFQIIMPLAFTVIALHFIGHMVGHAREALTGRTREEPDT